MEDSRFDAFTLRFASSRRGVVKALLISAAGLIGRSGAEDAGAATCRDIGSVCSEHAICCSRRCGPKDRTGRRRCECQSVANCPVPKNSCEEAVCSGGQCAVQAKQNGANCDDGNPCTENDTCQNGTCQGTPKTCPPCRTCTNGACRNVASDGRCSGSCVDGSCVASCVEVQAICAFPGNNCCQNQPTVCSVEANSSTQQGEARCCRPLGAACAVADDCCENADCVNGICGLGPGQQCVDRTECAGPLGECCSGNCRTVANDPSNCGACGRVCPAPPPGGIARCVDSNCRVECSGGRTLCNGACLDLDGDEANCGACGRACAAGETCCFGRCRDLSTDERNCGTCNISCSVNHTCCGGTCVDLLSDRNHCNTCANDCTAGGTFPDAVCCSGQCTDLRLDNENCGQCGLRCSEGQQCDSNGLCEDI